MNARFRTTRGELVTVDADLITSIEPVTSEVTRADLIVHYAGKVYEVFGGVYFIE